MSQVLCTVIWGARETSLGVCSLGGARMLSRAGDYYARGRGGYAVLGPFFSVQSWPLWQALRVLLNRNGAYGIPTGLKYSSRPPPPHPSKPPNIHPQATSVFSPSIDLTSTNGSNCSEFSGECKCAPKNWKVFFKNFQKFADRNSFGNVEKVFAKSLPPFVPPPPLV